MRGDIFKSGRGVLLLVVIFGAVFFIGSMVNVSGNFYPSMVNIIDEPLDNNSIPFEVPHGHRISDFSFSVSTKSELSFDKDSYYINDPQCVLTEDLDQDGICDIIVSTGYGDNFLFKGLGNGIYDKVPEFGNSYSHGIFARDLDDDGDIDLTFPGFTGESYIYENLGNFNFREYGLGDFDVATIGGAWADVDQDGDLDWMTANGGNSYYFVSEQDDLFINEGNFKFTRYDGLGSDFTFRVRACYLNDDEYPDFFSVGDGVIKFHINDGTGLDYDEMIVDEDVQGYNEKISHISSGVYDLDDDGDNDITISRDGEIVIFENDNGTYVVNDDIEIPSFSCMMDMDLDGNRDVIALEDPLYITPFDGEEDWKYIVDYGIGDVGAASIDDLENDTDPDIVLHTDDHVIIYTNLIYDSQRINATERVNDLLDQRTGVELYLDIQFPDREVVNITDIVISYEKIDDDIGKVDPGDIDIDHGDNEKDPQDTGDEDITPEDDEDHGSVPEFDFTYDPVSQSTDDGSHESSDDSIFDYGVNPLANLINGGDQEAFLISIAAGILILVVILAAGAIVVVSMKKENKNDTGQGSPEGRSPVVDDGSVKQGKLYPDQKVLN